MSDDDSRYAGSGIKVGALVGALLLSYFVLPPIKRFFGKTATVAALADPQRVDAALAADPGIGATATVLRARFPTYYAALRSRIQAAAAKREDRAFGGIVDATVLTILRRDGAAIARAPHAALDRLSAAELAVFEALRLRPRLCATFGTQAFDPGKIGPETAAVIAAVLPLRLAAIADGRDHPVRGAAPAPAERGAMITAALAGRPMGTEAYQMLTGQRAPADTTDRGRCEASIALIETVRALPADEGDALYGALLAPA